MHHLLLTILSTLIWYFRHGQKIIIKWKDFDEKAYFYVKEQSDNILTALTFTSVENWTSNLILVFNCEGRTFCVGVTDRISTQNFEGEYSDYCLKKIDIHISNLMVSHSLVKIQLKASQLKNSKKSEKVTSVMNTKSPILMLILETNMNLQYFEDL